MFLSADMLPEDLKKRFLEYREDEQTRPVKKAVNTELYAADNFELMRALRFNQSKGSLNESDGINCIFCKNKGMLAEIDEHKHIYFRNCVQCFYKRRNARAEGKIKS